MRCLGPLIGSSERRVPAVPGASSQKGPHLPVFARGERLNAFLFSPSWHDQMRASRQSHVCRTSCLSSEKGLDRSAR